MYNIEENVQAAAQERLSIQLSPPQVFKRLFKKEIKEIKTIICASWLRYILAGNYEHVYTAHSWLRR